MGSSSCDVTKEKGFSGSCFDNCTGTLCLFPNIAPVKDIFACINIYADFVLFHMLLSGQAQLSRDLLF